MSIIAQKKKKLEKEKRSKDLLRHATKEKI